ncbi:MAG TPA: hypothetical protein VNA20_02300 [Frankiaceae bacterium]|nr:hypothetical protein [Frankiaceae bacterium]
MPFGRLVSRCAVAALGAGLLVPLDATAATAAAEPAFVPGGVAVVAGNGTGDGGPATAARLPGTQALAYAPDGDLVIGGIYSVRRVDAETGTITTIAGTGASGTSADGGLATEAAFERVSDVAVAPDGAVHVADRFAGRVRRVDPVTGVITTVAGGGSTTAASGVAATAAFLQPVTIGFGPGGALYVGSHAIAGGSKGSIWRVEPDGVLTRVAGGAGATVTSLAAAPAGADWVVYEVADLTLAPGGDLVYSEPSFGRVVRVAGAGPEGTVTAVATDASGIHEVVAAADGSFVVGRNHYGIQRLSGAGALTDVPGGATCGVFGLTLRADGGIVATCTAGGNHDRVHAVPGDGTTPHLAGTHSSPDGTPAAAAFFSGLEHATAAPDGTVYFTEQWRLRAIGADGLVRTIAGQLTPGGPAGDGGPAVDAAFGYPTLLAVHPLDGSVYVVDGGRLVRRVVPGGGITTVLGGSTYAWSNGSPAADANLGLISSIAFDAAGALHVAGDACRVAKVVDGAIYAVAGPPECGGGLTLAFDPAGRLVTGRGSGSYERIERRAADGTWATLDSGGPRIAVRPDGSIETNRRSLRPDGARWEQSYRFEGYEVGPTVPLAVEQAGTLLAVVSNRLLRLTPAEQPAPAAVTGLTATPGPGTITLGWDPPATAVSDYVVRIVPGAVPPTAPQLGGVTAVAYGSATSITLRRGGDPWVFPTSFPGLRAGETYAFAIYARNPGGYSPAVTGTAVPQAEDTPPGDATNLSVTYADNRLVATWTRPGDDDLYAAIPRLTQGTTPAASATDGTNPTEWGDTSANWWVGSGGGTWTVRVFTFDVYGNAGPAPATVTFVRDTEAPAAVTGLRVALTDGKVVATWDQPAADVAQVRARVLVGGTSYPASPTSGVAPSSAGATSASWGSPQWGAKYHVAVFTTDAAGNTGAAATAAFVPLRPATLTLTRSASTVVYGARVTLSGRLTDTRTGAALGGQRVELWRRAKGTTTFAFRAAATTTSNGRVAFSELPAAHMEYRLRHPASAVAAASSTVSAVLVRAKVPVTPSSATARRGTAVHLYASVAPKHAGVPLTLQRYSGGVWRTVTTVKTATTGSVRFTVAPTAAGTYYYRVRFAGDAHHLGANSSTVRVAMT